MNGQRAACLLGCGLVFLGVLYAFQKPFHQLPGVEYFNFELTPDWQEKGEWTFARLMFPPGPNDGYAGRFDGDFRQGLSLWTQDYPRADRHFSQAVRRLTRIHVRSVEQPILLEKYLAAAQAIVVISGDNPEEAAAHDEWRNFAREKVEQFASTLKDKELEIFRSRLLSEDPPTLQEVGGRFGISRERVRQIEARLKQRLKQFLKSQASDIEQAGT